MCLAMHELQSPRHYYMSDIYLIAVRLYGIDGVFRPFFSLSLWVHTMNQRSFEQRVVWSVLKRYVQKDRIKAGSRLIVAYLVTASMT